MAVLQFDRLVRRFGGVVALDGVSFDVPEASIIGFVGPNGAGKTTAMRIAMGVLSSDAGSVRWRGAEVGAGARRRFGYMPEERGLYPKMRVHEQLVYLARLRGSAKQAAARAATDVLELLGVSEKANDRVESLSLGNQQRVQLAAALVHDPEVLILDEPFGGLDPIGVDVLSGVLRRRASGGVPVVFSSHQLDLVERLCDAVVLIHRGRVVASGSIDALRASRGRRLLRIDVRTTDADWFDAVPGVRSERRLATGSVLELDDEVDEQRLLDVARSAGDVTHLSRVEPTLAELFREVIR